MDVIAELENTSRKEWNQELYEETCSTLRKGFRDYPNRVAEAVLNDEIIVSQGQEKIEEWYEAKALMVTGIKLEDEIKWPGELAEYLKQKLEEFKVTEEEDRINVFEEDTHYEVKSATPSINPYEAVLETLESVFE